MFKLKLLLCAAITLQVYPATANVDPTSPFGKGSAKQVANLEDKLILESIIHGEGIHTAVINGKILKPLDTIGQYRLVAVNNDSVVLRSETERLKLYVFKASVLKNN